MKVLSGVYPHGSYEGASSSTAKSGAFATSTIPRRRDHHHPPGTGADPLMSIAENIFLSHPPARFGVIDRNAV